MIKEIIQEATHSEDPSTELTIKSTAVDKVKNYINREIVFGSLKAGDKIPTETELCKLLNVSRGSVREALKILEALSIIKIIRGDGTYISKVEEIHSMESILMKVILSDTSVAELTEFREELEFSVLNLAARKATDEEITQLQENVEKTRVCVESPSCDPLRLYELDNRFHELLGKCTHNLLIQEMYSFAHELIAPMLLKNYEIGQAGILTVNAHEAALEAIVTKDFRQMAYTVKYVNDVWMQSYYGKMKDHSALDRDVLNEIVLKKL